MVLPTPGKKVPPGVRFYPTDEELIVYYLRRKVLGKSICGDEVSELDIYDFFPWDLPKLGSLRSRNLIAYFFCPRRERCGKSGRACRLTKSGFWKATGEDRRVLHEGRLVGQKKTLIFHLGKSRKSERKDWVMHELSLVDPKMDEVVRDSYVLCKVFEKSGLGPKNGEQYGAPFNEKEWEDDDDNETQGIPASTSPTEGPSNCNNQEDSALTGILVPGHHYSGIVSSSSEPVSLENGALSSVDLPDPNACRAVVPVLEGPQDQPMVIFINNATSVEGLLEPSSNRTDAGMLAHATGQDRVMQDADFDGVFSDLSPLGELNYPSPFNEAGYAPKEADPAGDFLEQRDLDNLLSPLSAVAPQGAAPADDFLEQRDLDNCFSP